MTPVVHHVELCVQDGGGTLSRLQKFGFRLYAKREFTLGKQLVAKLGSVYFVITERKPYYDGQDSVEIRNEPLAMMCCENGPTHTVDTVFNVALSVKNVKKITERIKSHGGNIIQQPSVVEDDSGYVEFSMVRSCVGNVVHTLLDLNKYTGPFLPGYELVDCDDGIQMCNDIYDLNEKITHIDHVTLACVSGDSERIISFYESCFGMQKFSISRNDDDAEGLILEDGVGLRLRAMEYWRCAETGLIYPSEKGRNRDRPLRENGVMFVVVETLPGQKNCNVETFLNQHRQPGVEHIAFNTKNIFTAVQSMRILGVKFRMPPAAYYKQLKKVKQIEKIGENFEKLEALGILLDNEAESDAENVKPKYLMQIFAHPLFNPAQTFFIEVIQRSGARGLGAGNIIALVKSIREDEKRKAAEKDKRINRCQAEEEESMRNLC